MHLGAKWRCSGAPIGDEKVLLFMREMLWLCIIIAKNAKVKAEGTQFTKILSSNLNATRVCVSFKN